MPPPQLCDAIQAQIDVAEVDRFLTSPAREVSGEVGRPRFLE